MSFSEYWTESLTDAEVRLDALQEQEDELRDKADRQLLILMRSHFGMMNSAKLSEDDLEYLKHRWTEFFTTAQKLQRTQEKWFALSGEVL